MVLEAANCSAFQVSRRRRLCCWRSVFTLIECDLLAQEIVVPTVLAGFREMLEDTGDEISGEVRYPQLRQAQALMCMELASFDAIPHDVSLSDLSPIDRIVQRRLRLSDLSASSP
jgi:hypothetical protein